MPTKQSDAIVEGGDLNGILYQFVAQVAQKLVVQHTDISQPDTISA
jgi:hypothetical protein